MSDLRPGISVSDKTRGLKWLKAAESPRKCVCVCVSGLGSGAWCVCVYLLTVCLVATAMTSWHTSAERRKECLLSTSQTWRRDGGVKGGGGDRMGKEGWRGRERWWEMQDESDALIVR